MESSEVLKASSIRDGLYVIPVIEISESSEDESENANQNLHTRDISDCENSESKTHMEYLNQTEANNANGNKISLTKAPVDSSFHTNLFDEVHYLVYIVDKFLYIIFKILLLTVP